MRGMRRVLTAVAALAAAACASDTTNPGAGGPHTNVVQAGDTAMLKPGQVVDVGSDGVQLAFREVTEDSRCPINVVCVWAGNAEVVLEARMGRSAWKRLTVNSYVEPRAADYGAYRFHLVEVAPPQETPGTINAPDYRVRIAISRR
jgi:hypothetical protein